MNTNGWLVPDRIDEIAKLDLVCMTLDGPDDDPRRAAPPGLVQARPARRWTRSVGESIPARDDDGRDPGAASITSITFLEVARELGVKAFFQLEHDAEMDVARPSRPALGRSASPASHATCESEAGAGRSATRFEALEQQARQRYLLSCDHCYAGSYYGYVFSDGTVSQCLLTQAQVERGNGRHHGYSRAFQALARAARAGVLVRALPRGEPHARLQRAGAVRRARARAARRAGVRLSTTAGAYCAGLRFAGSWMGASGLAPRGKPAPNSTFGRMSLPDRGASRASSASNPLDRMHTRQFLQVVHHFLELAESLMPTSNVDTAFVSLSERALAWMMEMLLFENTSVIFARRPARSSLVTLSVTGRV